IALLAEHFVARFSQAMGKTVRGIADEARARLEAYPWPGNIRELENAMERAVALEPTDVIGLASLPAAVQHGEERRPGPVAERQLTEGFDLEQHVQEIERSEEHTSELQS